MPRIGSYAQVGTPDGTEKHVVVSGVDTKYMTTDQIVSVLNSTDISFQQSGAGASSSNIDAKLKQSKAAEDFPDLATLVSAYGGTEITIKIRSDLSITDNLTIPATMTLKVERGGGFTVSATKTLTINGPLNAGRYVIFGGAGSVAGLGMVDELLPEWWSATPSTGLQAAVDFDDGRKVSLGPGTFDLSTTGVTVSNLGVMIEGISPGASTATGTTIQYTGAGAAITFTSNSGASHMSGIRNCRLNGNGTGKYGLQLGNADGTPVSWFGLIENVYITGFQAAGGAGVRFYGSQNGTLNKVHADGNTNGFLFETNVTNDLVNTATVLTGCRAWDNDEIGLWIKAATRITLTNFVTESNGYEGIKIEKATASVSGIKFDGGWTEACQDDAGRSDGYYAVVVSGGASAIEFNGYYFDVASPWDGATGNKALQVSASTVILRNHAFVSDITAPRCDMTGASIVSISQEMSRSLADFSVGAGGYIQILGKNLMYAEAAPTTGTWNRGTIFLRMPDSSLSSIDSGGVLGWFCVTTGSPGTWIELGRMRILHKVTHASTGPVNVSQYGYLYLVSPTTASINVNLPDISAGNVPGGKPIIIQKIDASTNTVNVKRSGVTDVIGYAGGGVTQVTLSTQEAGVHLVSDETDNVWVRYPGSN